VLGIACLMVTTVVWAADKAKEKTKTVKAAGTTLTVGKALIHGNLAVFPVYGKAQRKVGSCQVSPHCER
jgi:hypothetical protein